MADINSNFDGAAKSVSAAAGSLHTIWTLADKAFEDGTESDICSLILDMLPVIGSRLDAALSELNGQPTGWFDEILRDRCLTRSSTKSA
ncbi:hypothetical protein [Burkholderia contaminans]|uniref:hypothetical protein n=1 Tax=Burkholderia contaminans TaxID=488447 RepID=UPI00158DFD20|nr:hypothetical protein [Burkholderia contaminans]